LGQRLAEVGEQDLPSARRRFAQTDKRLELLALNSPECFAAFGLVDPAAQLHSVLHAVGHPGIGELAVAPGAASLLVIGFNRFRQVKVATKRTSGLSIPMPNAMVATTIRPSS